MGILTAASPVMLICARDVAGTADFYRDVLGLTQLSEDKYAAIFRLGGHPLRVSLVPDFVPGAHTVLGLRVKNLRATVAALREKGVAFHRPEHLSLDADGIWTISGGRGQVAWFTDPEGNLLSITTVA